MVRIRVLTPVAGDPSWSAGDVVEVDEATAEAWCDGVRAERLAESNGGWLSPEEIRAREGLGPQLQPLAGGWYELPGGERIRGKRAAEARLAELVALEASGDGENLDATPPGAELAGDGPPDPGAG